MTSDRNQEFDAFLDDVIGPVSVPFLAKAYRATDAVFALDPTAYRDKRFAWQAEQVDVALGSGALPCHRKNRERFDRLARIVSKGRVLPFVGAGLSAGCGFPTWKQFLETLAKDHRFSLKELRRMLTAGEYEKAGTLLADHLGVMGFEEAFNRAFSEDVSPAGASAVQTLLACCPGPFITTNYDRVLEQYASPTFQVVQGKSPGEFLRLAREGQRVLLKVHGELNVPRNRVLTTQEYSLAYGSKVTPDFDRDLPRTLRGLFLGHTVLFVGCSLGVDRTMSILYWLAKHDPDGGMMCHYAITEAPKSKSALYDRERYLADRGVFPIWYEGGKHEQVNALLDHLLEQSREV
jgi:hypothetical protein